MKNKGQGLSAITVVMAAIMLFVIIIFSVLFMGKLTKNNYEECSIYEIGHMRGFDEICICQDTCFWKNMTEFNNIAMGGLAVADCDFTFNVVGLTDNQIQESIWSSLEQVKSYPFVLEGENGGYVIMMPKGCKYENMTKEYKTINDIPTESDCIDEDNCWIKIE